MSLASQVFAVRTHRHVWGHLSRTAFGLVSLRSVSYSTPRPQAEVSSYFACLKLVSRRFFGGAHGIYLRSVVGNSFSAFFTLEIQVCGM